MEILDLGGHLGWEIRRIKMSHPGNSVLAGYQPFPELLPADPYGSHNPHPCDNHSVFSHPDHPLKLVYFGLNIKGGKLS